MARSSHIVERGARGMEVAYQLVPSVPAYREAAPIAWTLVAQQPLPLPTSPGSSPEHWTTFSFIVAAITVLVICLTTYFTWRRVLARVKASVSFRVTVYLLEAAAAVSLSVVASYFDVFKKATYIPTSIYQPDWHVVFWAAVWAGIAACYCVSKLFAIYTKESEDFKSKALASELDKERAAIATLTQQRDLLAKITSFARQTVSRKTERLTALIPGLPVTIDQLIEQLNPKLQIQLMVKLIHEFFRPTRGEQAELRLALWVKSASANGDAERMVTAYSWNGHEENCFSGRSADRMAIADPLGTVSEVVKCYHCQPGTVKIIPDCEKAVQAGEMEYFYPGQKEKLASMILYKHVFMRDHGPVAVVLLLSSSMVGHFRKEESDQVRQFLDEMLTRIGLEWIVLELTRNMRPALEAASL